MSSRIIKRPVATPRNSALVLTGPETTSMRHFNASIRDELNEYPAHSDQILSTSWTEVVKIEVDFDSHPIAFRVIVSDLPLKMPSSVIGSADLESLFSGTLEEIVDRMKGLVMRRHESPSLTFAIEKRTSSEGSAAGLLAPPKKTELRVGPLELNLIDRVATRGGRQFDLRPLEFRLLKYMMERADKSLTRATLLQEVWHYKFVPKSNVVDVHMGKLRRKVDERNEPRMIRSVKGAGFILSSAP